MDNVIWCVLSPLPVARAGICVGTFAWGLRSVRLHLLWLLPAYQLLFVTFKAGRTKSGLTSEIREPFNPVRTSCQSSRVEPPRTDLLTQLIWGARQTAPQWRFLSEIKKLSLIKSLVWFWDVAKTFSFSRWQFFSEPNVSKKIISVPVESNKLKNV